MAWIVILIYSPKVRRTFVKEQDDAGKDFFKKCLCDHA